MKKLLIIAALITAVLLTFEITATNIASAHSWQEPSEKLVLNKRAKWKVDQTTDVNVKNVKAILQRFNGGAERSLTGYHKLAADLQSGLDKMIKECRMKGPDHVALHKWLEPLMERVTKLKQATTIRSAMKSFQTVKLQLNRYDQYFEL
jgi:hypothetical protein